MRNDPSKASGASDDNESDRGFYRAFEERFRGSRALILDRLTVYRPFLDAVKTLTPLAPKAVDLACGRGEWLELITSLGFDSMGVDLDDGMLDACHDLGLPAIKQDAFDCLASLPSASTHLVSSFHFIEHIEHEDRMRLFREAHRVLAPGGLLIIETPNPENIRVSTFTFHLDHTHKKPASPSFAQFLGDYTGFQRSRILRLQGSTSQRPHGITLTDVLSHSSRDFAVICQKSSATDIAQAFDAAFGMETLPSADELLERFDHRVDVTCSNVAELTNRTQDLTSRLDDVQAHIREIRIHLDDIEASRRSLERDLKNSNDRIAAIFNSTSWKVTGPLRDLKSGLKFLRSGVLAWGRLSPGSKPDRILKRVARTTAPHILNSPPLLKVARLALRPFPSLKSRLISSLGPGSMLSPALDIDDEVAKIPASVRLVLMRLKAQVPGSSTSFASEKPALAFFSPMLPLRTGIARYNTELIPHLTRYYDVHVIVPQDGLDDVEPPRGVCGVHDFPWFEKNVGAFDRIVYHIGNAPFHQYMFEAILKYPGIVVLHDFYLGHLLRGLEDGGRWNNIWTSSLYNAHGYSALKVRHDPAHASLAMWEFPANFFLFQQAQAIVAHSMESMRLTEKFYGKGWAQRVREIALLRELPVRINRQAARAALGLAPDEFLVCSFGFINEVKCVHELMHAWIAADIGVRRKARLVFVGTLTGGTYCDGAARLARMAPTRNPIAITGFAAPEDYVRYLEAADVAVQLRARSRGENSGAVIDCLAYGVPTIVNAHGSFRELPDDCVVKISDDVVVEELADAMIALADDQTRSEKLSQAAVAHIRSTCAPARVAFDYHDVIESALRAAPGACSLPALRTASDALRRDASEEKAWIDTAKCMAAEWQSLPPARRLFVDITVVATHDLRTGIQRVVRGQLTSFLEEPPQGFRVEPVKLVLQDNRLVLCYAAQAASKIFEIPSDGLVDSVVEFHAGDIYYMPDYYTAGVTQASLDGLYREMRESGVKIAFAVFDNLPIHYPEFFPDGARKTHEEWLRALNANADILVCISETVQKDTEAWLEANTPLPHPVCSAVHLGADLAASAPSKGLPRDAEATLRTLGRAPTFLTVGTIEPRKGHLQAIAAFEKLWREGMDVNLVIVGEEGWKGLPVDQRRTIPAIVETIKKSSLNGRRLFWISGVSDEYLEKLYSLSTCLLAASEDEGFGLPLIEAAQHGLPILARDTPIFREVAGDHAAYFSSARPEDLSGSIRTWLALHAAGTHPRSEGMPWLTWRENATRVASLFTS